jgi:hypothetical protein
VLLQRLTQRRAGVPVDPRCKRLRLRRSVAAEAAWRVDGEQFGEIEVTDRLQSFTGLAVTMNIGFSRTFRAVVTLGGVKHASA